MSINYEKRDFILPNETLVTELGRGCKFHCDFCYFPVLGVKGDYSRTSVDFDTNIRQLHSEYGVSSFILADETINDSTDKLSKFADVISKFDFSTYFTGFLRADLIVSRPGDIEIIKAMNLWGHHYGIESTNHLSTKSMGKGMKPEKLLQGMIDFKKKFKESGPYNGTISLIAGLPFETKEYCLTDLSG